MLNKIFISLIALNLLLFVGRVGLSMHLSTRGDDLSQISGQIARLQAGIDQLESQIDHKSSLENVSQFAQTKGFVLSKIIKFSPDSLAHAPQN